MLGAAVSFFTAAALALSFYEMKRSFMLQGEKTVNRRKEENVCCSQKTSLGRLWRRWRDAGGIGCVPMLILEGERVLTVRGCQHILSYTTEVIRLALGERCLQVEGERLLCRSFSAGAITVVGRISALKYLSNLSDEEGKR